MDWAFGGGQFAQISQDQQGGADNRQIDTQVEQHGACQLELAYQWQMEMIKPQIRLVQL